MPTTIYDSSLLTQRKRDKLIAQQIVQANRAGQLLLSQPLLIRHILKIQMIFHCHLHKRRRR